jgi:cytochrome bd-type quinol oxidase subunit 1
MGFSLAFHMLFAAVGVALPLFMVIADVLYRRTGDRDWLEFSKRMAKGTAILFAVGAVSGTVLSFELGLLWPGFMRYAGPLIGMPFSLEGFAFFLEAIFLGIYLYGWDRVGPRAHLAAGVVVAVSGAASAVFVVLVNAWMNAPTGFTLDAAREETRWALEIPYGLSLLAFHDPSAEVKGLRTVPPADRPPVAVVHLAFQTMVGLGSAMALVALWAVLSAWRRRALAEQRRLLRALVLVAPFGFIATEAGWVVTEVGRQPWVVQGLMRTASAVTPMPGLIVPMVLFTLLYLGLGAIVVALIASLVRETARVSA